MFTLVAADGYAAAPATVAATAAPGYNAVATEAVTAAGTTLAAVYYYGDYDNVLAASDNGIYYQSALTPEAIMRTGQGDASAWTPAAKVQAANPINFKDAKGIALCGAQYAAADNYGQKYKQVFVADAGDDMMNNGAVYGWQVAEDPMNPKAVVLSGKWTVYQPADGAKPVDVECGPNNGLLIADSYTNQINYVSYDAVVAAAPKPKYSAVISADCGAAVADVRSISYDADNNKLTWTNNAAVPTDAGVFSYSIAADATTPPPAACDATMCNVGWSQACAAKVQQVQAGAAMQQYWAVANAWDATQVSKGDDKLYEGNMVVAQVASQATYADATDDMKRDVVLVADQTAGNVYAVPNGGDAKKIGAVADVYGVAYNNAYGWNGAAMFLDASSSVVTLAFGAVLAAAALLL
jgi:hypothetical protein